MKIGNYELKLEKRVALSGINAAVISIISVICALLIFSLIFIQADINPFIAFKGIFSFAFGTASGLPLALNRFIFLLLCTGAFIIPFRAGLWNIGMAGQMYAGALGAFAVLYAFGAKSSPSMYLSPYIAIPLMMLVAGLCGAFIGGIAGFIKGKFKINEIVITMIINFIMFYLVAHMIKEGGPFMNPGGRGESFELPVSVRAPTILGVPFTVFIALFLIVFLYWLLAKTQIGYKIRAFGLNPSAARYAGINPFRISLLVFSLGGLIAGLAGYHYFAAVPGVFKIARNYGEFGDLSFYGIICGLIAQGNPLAAIPIALLFGGLTVGGRYIQGKMQMVFGIDYALLGIMMITMVAFQFFYRYKIVWIKSKEEK